jgi:4-carboxymuconolactone decarboxylase
MNQQYQRGLQELQKINPSHALQSVEELKRISPDIAEYFVSFGHGEIYSRNILDPKTKALVVVASLIGLGNCDGYLQTQVLGALHAGCTREQIVEVALQNIQLIGFPNTLLALKNIQEAFASESSQDHPPAE